MGAKLLIQPGTAAPFEVSIGNTATIGRTRENTVCLNQSPLVSRQHALIRCHNAYQYQLIDLGSRNGTYVDERRVVMPVTLEPGARIRIADNAITFLQEESPHAEEPLQMTVAAAGSGEAALVSRAVALLVCDIRGFSTMSEKMPSSEVAQLIGEWFRETANRVQRTTGTVDKFIGDAVLAYWATGTNGAGDCGAALDVARQFLVLAAQRQWPNGDPLKVAIALHYGRVTFSNVGVSERDATIIGDVVNTVFRLEVLSKRLGHSVVLSREFADQLPPDTALIDCGEQALKGKAQPVRVFAVAD
jgi:adenylate cyclase